MGAPEIFIEHRRGEKVHKYLRVKSDTDLFLIGSSKEADLRLAGEQISGCHAVLKYRNGGWFLCDVSGTETILVGENPVIERRVDDALDVQIGDHHLKLFSRERETKLFGDEETTGALALQQVVIRSRGRVIETRVLQAHEPFVWQNGEHKVTLPAPVDGKWVHSEFGPRVIQQRLVPAQELAQSAPPTVDEELRKPLLILLAFVFVMVTISALMPKSKPEKIEDVVLDKKSMDMIFSAKTIKKKQIEAKKIAGSRIRQGGNTDANTPVKSNRSMPDEATGPKANPQASAALSKIRTSGLSQLVGKIAKRANKQGVMVAAAGVSPDTKGSGRAIYSMGTTTTGGGGAPAKEGDTFKIGGVGTKGVGGGSSDFRAGTGLTGGLVGQGEVGIVDEETVIEGGLDRDVIAEVIKRNIGQIRYCYERQLSSNPELYGKVMVKFDIQASGSVAAPLIGASTLKSAMVEGCILRRVASWKFPLPKGGTVVKVSYPFLFKAMD